MNLEEVELLYTPVINFAMQQNYVPVIKKFSCKNVSGKDLEEVKLTIKSDPAFATALSYSVDIIRKDEAFDFSNLSLNLSSKFLADLTERVSGCLSVTVTAKEEVIYNCNYPINLLAYDQWNGISILPELLSSFITPNHPLIPKIIREASAILNTWTGNPSFDEYQSRNPDRVKKQMAALYEAISKMNIVYCSVPASFEESGQRIRLCDTIFSNLLGNCLDLSLLYAGCLEAVGIHPLVIINKGHAFAGGWLAEESFADAVNDDPSLLTKRTAAGINEIALVEATCMNAGNSATFDDAGAAADFRMVNVEEFVLFIDVKRSRFSGIRPLPLRVRTDEGWVIKEAPAVERKSDQPMAISITGKLEYASKIEITKQTLWERKLLDLTLRNSLLNLRVTKNTIQFIGLNLFRLEDSLAKGHELQILPRPTDWDNPLRSAGVYQSLNQSDPVLDLVEHEFTQKRLRAYLTEAELLSSITSLYRAARLSIEENGANTLYIALGLLKWYENSVSERPRYAPLLLVPVEIIKKSAQKGFIIRSREEETIINITLLEMLRQDFGIQIGGLENLPRDEFGVNVQAVFNIARQAVMSLKGWDVEEQCFLSTFSFNKFILWNDIHNNAQNLLKNKVVQSLVSGKLEWEPGELKVANPDKEIHPGSLSLPVPFDASQLQAIASSSNKETFVLHGPPGTGKSQTITNIIANALGQGKKVLFVSAKKAALEVVHNRLQSIGIGAFCLELHSNKSKKSAVLDQLKAAIDVAHNSPPGNFTREAERLYQLRSELADYAAALHKRYSFGFSLFELFDRYSALPPAPVKIFFSAEDIASLTELKVTKWNDIVSELQVIGQICGEIANHPLKEVQTLQYSQQAKAEVRQYLATYLKQLSDYQSLQAEVTDALKWEGPVLNKVQSTMLENLITLLLKIPDVPTELFAIGHAEQSLVRLEDIAGHGLKRDELKNLLCTLFSKEILSTDATSLLREWNASAEKWFFPKFLKQHSILKVLKNLSLSRKIEKESVPRHLDMILSYQEEQSIIDKAADLPGLLQFLWKNGECDWEMLKKICGVLLEINRAAGKLSDPLAASEWRKRLSALLSEGSKVYVEYRQPLLEKYIQAMKDLSSTEDHLKELLQIDFEKLPGIDTEWIKTLQSHCTRWNDHIELLKDHVNWNQARAAALDEGLEPVVTGCDNGDVIPEEIVTEYKRAFYTSCADYIIDQHPGLSSFNGKLFDEKIRRFKEAGRLFEQLTRQELYSRLAANIPDFTFEGAQSSETGILQKAIRHNGRGTSLRNLFDSIPNLLPRLAPCMLMSPISVAQYFDTTSEKFDLLVFDEASQLPTCEAVGAIARAGNVIVVGDPKQMPPTSFFSTNNFDEENIDKEDLESILDDCLALSIPSKHLLWHYRSRHESLIAFSNAKFYDNKLLTFPSIDDILSKVTYVPVEGFYDKGKTRQNRAEAKMIVDEVIRRLSDRELSKRSIGIVTFSSVQQFLIEDLLNEVFATRPELEKLATETEEPLFIKNLENVQGDERDIILFSVGYGPDKEGKVSLNFGPVNREGGWRRLNVAVTRSRYEMKVFATLRSDQIDLARTSSEGVASLKAFLAYAEKGKSALPGRQSYSGTASSAFVNTLASQVQQHGYSLHTDIGCSTYRIDIGVVNPANPHEYLLGILCDGDNYFRARTARDREVTQPEVLKSLGWHLYKVWSADWWENPEKTISGIVEAIRQVQNGEYSQKLPEVAEPVAVPIETVPLNHAAAPPPRIGKPYEICQLETTACYSTDHFLYPGNKEKIEEQIKQVLDTEAPVSTGLLSRRILSAWGIGRNSSRIQVCFESHFSTLSLKRTRHSGLEYLWREDQQPADYSEFRFAATDEGKRSADDIPPEEILAAVRFVLKQQLSLSHEDLIRETAKLFSFSKVGTNVEHAMKQGIRLAVEKGVAREEENRISIFPNKIAS